MKVAAAIALLLFALAAPLASGRPDATLAPIELTPAAREALLELRLEAVSEPVFLNRTGGRRGLSDVQRGFRKVRELAALPVTEEGEVVFHSLRHTGTSRAANHPRDPACPRPRLRPPRGPCDDAGLRS